VGGEGERGKAYCNDAATHEELCEAKFVDYPVHRYDNRNEKNKSVYARRDKASVCPGKANRSEDSRRVVLYPKVNTRIMRARDGDMIKTHIDSITP
jgi:hypothetical protein